MPEGTGFSGTCRSLHTGSSSFVPPAYDQVPLETVHQSPDSDCRYLVGLIGHLACGLIVWTDPPEATAKGLNLITRSRRVGSRGTFVPYCIGLKLIQLVAWSRPHPEHDGGDRATARGLCR